MFANNATARAFRALWRRSDPAYRVEPYDPSWSVTATLPATRTDERAGHKYTPGCPCHTCKWG